MLRLDTYCSASNSRVHRNRPSDRNESLLGHRPSKSNGYRLQFGNRAHPDKLSPSVAVARTEGGNLSGTGATPDVRARGDNIVSPLEPLHESSEQPPLQSAPTSANRKLQFPPGLAPDERAAVASIIRGIEHAASQALLDELCAALEDRTIRTSPLQWFRSLADSIAGSSSQLVVYASPPGVSDWKNKRRFSSH